MKNFLAFLASFVLSCVLFFSIMFTPEELKTISSKLFGTIDSSSDAASYDTSFAMTDDIKNIVFNAYTYNAENPNECNSYTDMTFTANVYNEAKQNVVIDNHNYIYVTFTFDDVASNLNDLSNINVAWNSVGYNPSTNEIYPTQIIDTGDMYEVLIEADSLSDNDQVALMFFGGTPNINTNNIMDAIANQVNIKNSKVAAIML